MNATHSLPFQEFQAGMTEGLNELAKLSRYCSDSLDLGSDDIRTTLVDLEHQIQDAADLIRAHCTFLKRAVSKGQLV